MGSLQSLGDLFNADNATAGMSPFLQVTPACKYTTISFVQRPLLTSSIVILPLYLQASLTADSPCLQIWCAAGACGHMALIVWCTHTLAKCIFVTSRLHGRGAPFQTVVAADCCTQVLWPACEWHLATTIAFSV